MLRQLKQPVSQNFGVHTAWMKAKERDTWHQVVSRLRQRSARSSPPRRRRQLRICVHVQVSPSTSAP